MGGAVNALLTLRESNLLFLCGVSATALFAAEVQAKLAALASK